MMDFIELSSLNGPTPSFEKPIDDESKKHEDLFNFSCPSNKPILKEGRGPRINVRQFDKLKLYFCSDYCEKRYITKWVRFHIYTYIRLWFRHLQNCNISRSKYIYVSIYILPNSDKYIMREGGLSLFDAYMTPGQDGTYQWRCNGSFHSVLPTECASRVNKYVERLNYR